MKIITRIGRGTVIHAAEYDPHTGKIDLYCDSLKYPDYFAAIGNAAPPSTKNVSCKKCLKNITAWEPKGSE